MTGYNAASDGTAITPTFWNENVTKQVVSIFASTSARDTALPSPHNGAMCVVLNGASTKVQCYFNSTWNDLN